MLQPNTGAVARKFVRRTPYLTSHRELNPDFELSRLTKVMGTLRFRVNIGCFNCYVFQPTNLSVITDTNCTLLVFVYVCLDQVRRNTSNKCRSISTELLIRNRVIHTNLQKTYNFAWRDKRCVRYVPDASGGAQTWITLQPSCVASLPRSMDGALTTRRTRHQARTSQTKISTASR